MNEFLKDCNIRYSLNVKKLSLNIAKTIRRKNFTWRDQDARIYIYTQRRNCASQRPARNMRERALRR